MVFELNNKWNQLIKGFPGVLNTLGTLLDRSQTIKQKFNKISTNEGSHGPQGPWAQNHKIIKIIENHENYCFFSTWKRCASQFWEGSTERQLQIIDMELLGANSVFEKVSKSAKKCQKCRFFFKFGSEPCAWPLGYGGWLDASNPWCYVAVRPPGGFSAKNHI